MLFRCSAHATNLPPESFWSCWMHRDSHWHGQACPGDDQVVLSLKCVVIGTCTSLLVKYTIFRPPRVRVTWTTLWVLGTPCTAFLSGLSTAMFLSFPSRELRSYPHPRKLLDPASTFRTSFTSCGASTSLASRPRKTKPVESFLVHDQSDHRHVLGQRGTDSSQSSRKKAGSKWVEPRKTAST